MLGDQCPVCQSLNAPQAQRCEACGAALGTWASLPPIELSFNKIDAAGALWLDDLRQAPDEPRAVGAPDSEPISLTLREIEMPAAPAKAVEEPPPADAAVERAERKAAQRAQVRRARLRDAASAHAGEASAPAPQVWVLAAADAAREQLCGLLRAFGFVVQTVARPALQTAAPPIVAVFVDSAIDLAGGGDGIDLCQQLRDADRRRGGAAPLLVLVAGQLRPMDQVRAKLAGCDEILHKPVTRGSVASVLDGRGVALPSDARHR